METSNSLQTAFQRYLANRYSEQDLRLIQDHFGRETSRELLIQLVEAELLNEERIDDELRVDRVLDRTDNHIAQYLKGQRSSNRTLYKKLFYISAAAAAVVLVVLGVNFYSNMPARLIQASAGYGQTKEVVLPDGSHIWLNAGTTIEYPEEFRDRERMVNLKDGQAFFEVKHDADHPFRVVAQGLDVTVLGTSFDVKSFITESAATVTVNTGKVGVMPKSRPATMLLPGQQARLDKSTGQLTTREVDAMGNASWRDRKLVFEKERFGDIVLALERRYDVQIKVNNPQLLQQEVTLRLDNQPLEQVLSVMAFSNNFKYTINGRIVMVN